MVPFTCVATAVCYGAVIEVCAGVFFIISVITVVVFNSFIGLISGKSSDPGAVTFEPPSSNCGGSIVIGPFTSY